MSVLELVLREEPPAPVDLSPLLPSRLAGLSPAAVRALRLDCGGASLSVGDLFEIKGRAGDGLRLEGGSARLQRVGAGLDGGSIEVIGRLGDEPGRGMTAGTLSVRGSVGARAGAGMSGGLLAVTGSVGDDLAGPCPGQAQGMSGGLIVVGGSAGDRVAERLRRGVVVVKGDAGAHCGNRMLAGTLLVLGRAGALPGLGMQRGSVVLRQPPESLPATFNPGGRLDLPFLGLLYRRLAAQHDALKPLARLTVRADLYGGDAAFGGKGELLLLAA